jgi:hypothetical protein
MTKQKRQRPGDEHYVENRSFTLALDDYSRACKKAELEGKQKPQMNNYLGECIIKMSNRLANSPRFRNYSFREEMIHNGILAAVKYAHKFDGDRFDNGFAYVTQILFSHFIITIKNEKKKYETNLKLIQEAEVGVMGNSEFQQVANDHARSIADQKLQDLEENKMERSEDGKSNRRGFHLRSGYTKESRANYSGTPLKRD